MLQSILHIKTPFGFSRVVNPVPFRSLYRGRPLSYSDFGLDPYDFVFRPLSRYDQTDQVLRFSFYAMHWQYVEKIKFILYAFVYVFILYYINMLFRIFHIIVTY